MAGHKFASAKGDRGINSKESKFVFNRSKILIPFGTLICRRCKTKIKQLLENERLPEIVLPTNEDEIDISAQVTEEYLHSGGAVQKVHISQSCRVPSHCNVHALSDSNEKDYRQTCDHVHDERCPNCEALDSTLLEIERLLTTVTFANDDDHDEAVYLCQKGKQNIVAWKCHLVRSVRQDKARLDTIDQLDDDTILVINDWAMKFLPQYYRESQTDWFGKRGISWHISVVYRR
ncbi:uncharacterized protein LOC114574537 [Exaiptasia diaphana]|uniref:Uncharacterized protein n=1 Tax=Exaiptasia diaphana TaxID=2652724 RepID=A0A913YDS3_EXADI|nr:uncharacterized protein LOC114574537 [Exaiptasia diaphana]